MIDDSSSTNMFPYGYRQTVNEDKIKSKPECRCQTMSITTSLNVSFISLSFAPEVTGEKTRGKKKTEKLYQKLGTT